ncbi:peptidylprolyl isomerase [Polyangium jinanense]|uniref:Peptidyl-prolyl cis-trans isomerase n=1 Tax=Polyangium jinanense TaxID=2829994 RepID=A0A9X3XFG9_9BACT|nr:peptidylprolyl isomerase [Polyangium jinanense]MDC3961374.1 peptidylprolyl isomerase [Polyangium jinanense]MDC3987753.1 peptidylprolyl isomerase [Polyangium jinanense]
MSRSLLGRLSLAASFAVLAACSQDEAPRPHASPSATAVASMAPAAPSAAPATSAIAPATGGRDGNDPLFHPEKATEKAPDVFKVKFSTTKGDFVVQVTRAWAPNGADRFYNLVKLGFYDGVRFHRAIDDFMVQFGIHPEPAVNGAWYRAYYPDDPVVKSNRRGFVTFAHAGKDTRTTQIFISYVDKQARLDTQGFAPFGQVVEGMKVVDSFYKGYGELAPKGKGPNASKIQREGYGYLDANFPKLDAIKEAKIVP